MQLVNIPTGRRPGIAHFPGPSREGPFQKWLFNEINSWDIKTSPPSAHYEIVCFASSDVAASSPLVAQCRRIGVPITVLGSHMSREEFGVRSHFNKLYLLREHIDSGCAAPYIIALDAGDVLLCGDPADVVAKYHRLYDGKIVFGAESHFMYKMAAWHGYSIDGGPAREELETIKRESERRCRTFAEWKYLNGGMMIAPRGVLRVALDDAISIAEEIPASVYHCDQSIWMWLWAKNTYPIDLDFECELFQNLNHAQPWCFCVDCKAEGRIEDGRVDAVFLFCGQDTRDLTLSVRLTRKNMANLGRIFVIGGDPIAVAAIGGVEHIPFADPNVKNREANMTRKCLVACHLSRISDPFILMSDDQFVMKSCDAAAMPLRYKGSLEHGRIETTYGQRTRETYLECIRLGLPTLNYNTHYPVPIRKQTYIDALRLVPWDTESGDGILCRSIYGNARGGGEWCMDAKDRARAAIEAIDAPVFSLPNSATTLYPIIEAGV